MHTQQQPKDYTRRTSGAHNQADASKQEGFRVFDSDAESVHHPPWFVFGLAWFGILVGLGSNCWQVVTSVIAFFHMFVAGAVYQSMDQKGQSNAAIGALLVSIGMAVAFQLGVMFFVFRVSTEFKEVRTRTGLGGMERVKYTAVAMMNQHKLLLIWSLISFAADTVGDFTFISILTNDSFLLFMYAASLYAASTILLSKALEKHWAASVAYENWRAFKLYTGLMAEKLRQKKARAGNV